MPQISNETRPDESFGVETVDPAPLRQEVNRSVDVGPGVGTEGEVGHSRIIGRLCRHQGATQPLLPRPSRQVVAERRRYVVKLHYANYGQLCRDPLSTDCHQPAVLNPGNPSRAHTLGLVGRHITTWVITTAMIVVGCATDGEAVTTMASSSTTTTTSPRALSDGDLLVIGDWGSGALPQEEVAGAMMRHSEGNRVDAILTTGDNFYSDDAEFLMKPFGWAIEAGIPFWLTWGNHDLDTPDRIAAINEIFDDPPRWTTYRWGNVLVVILDSTQPDSEDQIDFLTETLADTALPTVVVFHHPPYSCGSYGHNETIQQNWVTRFDDDVFLVLSGHEHNYQRFEDGERMFVVTGGGGATLTELSDCPNDGPEAIAAEATHHFLVMEQTEELLVTALDSNGGVLDEFSLALP
jgi:hypothetical protein